MKPTQKQVIAWARKAGIAKYGLGWTCWEGQLERFTTLVYEAGRKEEREACAQIAHDTYEGFGVDAQGVDFVKQRIMEAIRARGQG